jgi:outer membrane scaffolding protein for murein synthesis (MipA/OmpV family)
MKYFARTLLFVLLSALGVSAHATELTAGVSAAGKRLPAPPQVVQQETTSTSVSTLQAEFRGAQFVVAETSAQPLFSSTKHQVITLVEHSQDPWSRAFDLAESRETINLGAEYRYQDFWGTLAVTLVSEMTDKERGEYGKISYNYPFQVGDNFVLSPEVSYTYMNGEYLDQYLGLQESRDPALGVTTAATSRVSVGLGAKQGVSERWQLNYKAAVGVMDPAENSTEPDVYDYTLGVGVAYSF